MYGDTVSLSLNSSYNIFKVQCVSFFINTSIAIATAPTGVKVAYTNTLYAANAFNRLIDLPPTKLTQLYYSCHYELLDALTDAIGQSNSQAGVYVTLALFFLLRLLLYYLNRRGAQILPVKKKKAIEMAEEEEDRRKLIEMLDFEFPALKKAIEQVIKFTEIVNAY